MRNLYLITLMLSCFAMACSAHEVGGKTSKEVFESKSLRELADAACEGKTRKIEKLIKNGSNPNGQGFQGASPLMWALSCRNIEGVNALLSEGADPNLKSKHDMTPTTVSASFDDPQYLKVLLEAGGDPNSVENDRTETILMIAFTSGVEYGEWRKYYMLLEASADINYVTSIEGTIAQHASFYRRQCRILELIQKGYSVRLDDLLYYVEAYPPLKNSPDMQCQDRLVRAIKERILELK